jgi:C1A family cysteine protease
MRTFALAILAASAQAFITAESSIKQKFLFYLTQFGKDYKCSYEFEMRFNMFAATNSFINTHNDISLTSKLAHNQFSDWTTEEYESMLNFQESMLGGPATNLKYMETGRTPSSIDWRELGAVNPIQDQGSCGSCWAFSGTATVEMQQAARGGGLWKYAEQECVDCDTACNGCNGGLKQSCMAYIQNNNGVASEDSYPYKAVQGVCQGVADLGNVNVTDVIGVPPDQEAEMLAAIANGPISVAVDASQTVFRNYSSGVITDGCPLESSNHAINAVGYGTDEDGTDYYIVRNSWGTGWGEGGYAKLGRTGDGVGVCGIQAHAYWAEVTV